MSNNTQNTLQKKISKLIDSVLKGKLKSMDFNEKYKLFHKADIAEIITDRPQEDQVKFFQKLPAEVSAEIFEEIDIPNQISIIQQTSPEESSKIINEMQADNAVDLIEELIEQDRNKAAHLLESLPADTSQEIQLFLNYNEDSAGAIMNSEYLAIPEKLSVAQAIKFIRKIELSEKQMYHHIYIIDQDTKLVGYINIIDLLLAPPRSRVSSIRHNNPLSTHIDTDQEEVASIFKKYDITTLPVVTNDNVLKGVITIDDVMDVIEEEANEDFLLLSGLSEIDENDLINGRLTQSLASRLPWLFMTIVGGFLASLLISTYSKFYTSEYFSLALSLSFIPLLMGLSGNVGNQSATIMIRGISGGYLKESTSGAYVIREGIVGILIGIILGVCIGVVSYVAHKSILMSLVVSISVLINLTLAALLGGSLPIVFKKLRIDPAIASAPFISTSLDIIGQIIYFTITLITLNYFAI